MRCIRHLPRLLAAAPLGFAPLAPAQAPPAPASFLEQKGYLVANLEMPWSGRREYDVPVDAETGPQVPVLFVAPKNDYPGLVRVRPMMFDALPRHALTRMAEPDASHIDAPSAAREETARWIAEVAGAQK